MKRIFLVFAIAALVFVLAACSAATPTPQTTEPPSGVPAATSAGSSSQVVEVSIKNFAFNPDPLNIKVGTTVKWTNEDSVVHNVISDSQVFTSSELSQGDTFSFTFTTAGTFTYSCSHHPNMKGTIIVTQ